jgi:hypothetical protein
MVKEDIDKLLEAGFIYPVNNMEWVFLIVGSLRRRDRTER